MQLYPNKVLSIVDYKKYFSETKASYSWEGDVLLAPLSTASSCPKNGFLTYATAPEIQM